MWKHHEITQTQIDSYNEKCDFPVFGGHGLLGKLRMTVSNHVLIDLLSEITILLHKISNYQKFNQRHRFPTSLVI